MIPRPNIPDSPSCKSCTGQCCNFAPMTRREFKDIRKKHGVPRGATLIEIEEPGSVMVVTDSDSGTCAYLKDARCSIYEDRPWICRKYGANDFFPCKLANPFKALKRHDEINKLRELSEGSKYASPRR